MIHSWCCAVLGLEGGQFGGGRGGSERIAIDMSDDIIANGGRYRQPTPTHDKVENRFRQ